MPEWYIRGKQEAEPHTWVYVFVRTDMPVPQIAVQSGHAALEAGHAFDKPSIDPSSLIILAVKNKEQLTKALEHVKSLGLRTVEFFEPDWDYGFTSFATEPLQEDQRRLLRKYQLWKGQSTFVPELIAAE
jgi:uncharacterized protein (UPF0128 family)